MNFNRTGRQIRSSIALMACLLAACGGGGGGDSGAPSPSPPPAPAPDSYGPALEGTATISRLAVPAVTPLPAAALPKPLYNQRYLPTGRKIAWGDFNGDGLNDLIMCPSFFSSRPLLPCEIWLNRGGGTFTIGTSEVAEGVLGPQAGVNSIFVADFNGDGKPDVFIATQGQEDPDASNPDGFKSRNRVFMSQPGGKLKDTTATALASDTVGFHHPSAMGDIDGDGWLDIAICELGGLQGSGQATGLYFLLNDRRGGFVRSTAGLPVDLASTDFTGPNPPQLDHFGPGTVRLVDLDGDGRLDLVTTTYIWGTASTHAHETRVYQQQADRTFLLRNSIAYPAQLAAMGASDGTGLGASGIVAGDIDGDGRPDLVILFENMGISGAFAQVLRNDGDFSFTDTTASWLGKYDLTIRQQGASTQTIGVSAVKLIDLNNDGKLDLYLSQGGFFHNALASVSPFYLNDGTGKLAPWMPLIGGKRFLGQTLPDPQWIDLLKIPYTNNTDLLAFDATGDGLVDWVFIDGLTDPSTEPPVPIDGMYTENAIFIRVVPQVAK